MIHQGPTSGHADVALVLGLFATQSQKPFYRSTFITMTTDSSIQKNLPPTRRLGRSLKGHQHELWAAFERSAAHKLPGSKGRLRENAVGKFLQTWIPRRYSPLTNVFLTAPLTGEFPLETDLVLHDSHDGAQWPLDGENENSVVTLEHVKMVFEVKSTLDKTEFGKAATAMTALKQYAEKAHTPCPRRVLFAYRIHGDYTNDFLEWTAYANEPPFDAIVILELGAFLG